MNYKAREIITSASQPLQRNAMFGCLFFQDIKQKSYYKKFVFFPDFSNRQATVYTYWKSDSELKIK